MKTIFLIASLGVLLLLQTTHVSHAGGPPDRERVADDRPYRGFFEYRQLLPVVLARARSDAAGRDPRPGPADGRAGVEVRASVLTRRPRIFRRTTCRAARNFGTHFKRASVDSRGQS